MDSYFSINRNRSRNIYFSGEATQESIGRIVEVIIEINQADQEEIDKSPDYVLKPIHLFINSVGGDTWSSNGLIDIITSSHTPVYTYNNGICASAGLDILVSGHRRFGRANSTYLIHQVSGGKDGEYQKMKEYIEYMEDSKKMSDEYYIKRTKITKEFLKNIQEKKIDYYFFSKEALDLSIIDEIL